MIVVADTSPLNYLVLIDEIGLLPTLFGQVVVPETVLSELKHPKAPSKVRQWFNRPPAWLTGHAAISISNPALMRLDRGEREAIQLALDLGVDTVLIDEAEGRQLAEAFHLEVRGTLGILERGARLGKVDCRQVLRKLEQTNFRLSRTVREAFLRRNL
jgi:predicted nucleic acid-binding protein